MAGHVTTREMSKGKRKSLPGAYQIVQQKLRTGTLSEDDRNTLHQLARLDLIDLIENELGLQLKGSHKNSVAAMVEYLLGPEGGQVPGRYEQQHTGQYRDVSRRYHI